MTLGIRTKLFLVSLGLIVVAVVVVYAFMRMKLSRAYSEGVRDELFARAQLVAADVGDSQARLDDFAAWNAMAHRLGVRSHAHVTLVRSDGAVLGDSQVPLGDLRKLDSELQLPEITAALSGGKGYVERAGSDDAPGMLFVAVPIRQTGRIVGVARLGMPLTLLSRMDDQLERMLTIATVLALLCAVAMSSVAAHLASRTARSLTAAARRMAEGDLDTRTRLDGNDEFGELGRALDQLAANLSSTLYELRTQRDRMGGILSGMHEGVLLLDGEGRVVLVNPALREMLLLPADAEGKTPLELIRHAELKELLDAAGDSSEHQAREIELGGLKPRRALVRAAPLGGEQGGVFAVFVDVTEMRRLESMRRDFVANVSHELRTPVTAIRSAAETLHDAAERDPEAAMRFVDIIDRNAERLHGLVEDLLDLSRIESREFRLAFEPLSLEPVFSHVLGLFRERADKKQIRLVQDVPADLPLARADLRALENVLTNLIDNAVKYCGEGAEVRLSASHDLDADAVRVVVEDTGPGIEARHLSRLFERFYRVDAGRSRQLGGTGLGLSIVKHLVEAMGGSVGVDSEPGRGTRFRFSLPRVDKTDDQAAD